MQRIIDKYGTRNLLTVILTMGMAVRLVAASVTKGHWFDLYLFGQWGQSLKFRRTDEFFYVGENPDHLPGDLWFHWLLSISFHSFGGDHYWGDTYTFLLRVLPSVADMVIALLIFDIVRNLVSSKSGLIAATIFFLNPAPIFLSGVWGQWDSVSMALFLAGLALVVGRPDRWIWSVPFIAWATVVKPPLALPGILIIALPMLLTLRDSPTVAQALRKIVPVIVGCAMLGLATIVIICMPFSVGLPGMATNWTIFGRAQIALDMYPYKVLSAGNIWMLPQGSFDQIDDRKTTFLSVNSHDLGNVFLGVAFVVISGLFAYLVLTKLRDRPFLALSWAMATATFATFMLPTRVHERYIFPAFVLLILLNGLFPTRGQGLVFLSVVSGTFLANLCFVYFGFNNDDFIDAHGAGFVSLLLRTISVINVVAFVVMLLLPVRWIRGEAVVRVAPRPIEGIRNLPAQ